MNLKKTTSIFIASAMGLCLSFGHAFAAEKTQDGVKLVITADKTIYDDDERISAELKLENNSGSDITDVSLEAVIPENYHLSDESKAVLRATYIMSGDSISSELVFVPDKKQNDTSKKKVKTTVTAENIISETTSPETVTASDATQSSTAENTVNNNNTDKTAPYSKYIITGIILLAAGTAVVIFIKKGRKNGIMILFCVTAAALCSEQTVKADDSGVHTFSVSETVTVAGNKTELTVNVEFTMDIPDMQAAVEEYYEDNSEEIISVEDVEETEEAFTEKEVIKLMAERGFTEYPVTYEFKMDGTYVEDTEASAESDEKHPMYQTYYIAEDNSIWTVIIVGKTITANPASYNLESDNDAQILVSETDNLTSYTEMGNKYYKTVPKESAVILKSVDKITSEKLNDLTYKEVINQ